MIYCIWYPSGGFGHFINAVISLHGKNFVRPDNKKIEFSANGNVHALELVAPKYVKNPEKYNFDFDPKFNYSVLIDNGINDESLTFQKFFPTATVIKICYNDTSWPIVARTMIDKALESTVEQELEINSDKWPSSENWAKREKYFLFLRDHYLRNAWNPGNCNNISVNDMLNYEKLFEKINSTGIELENFKSTWDRWQISNQQYFDPVLNSMVAIEHVENNKNLNLNHFDDLWSQAVLYYFIWIKFSKEVPHNDYSDFFADTKSIRQWLNL